MHLSERRVAVLAENLYEDLELWYPLLRLREAGAEVFVVGAGPADQYTSLHGLPVKPDAEADVVDAAQFDAIIIPGGYAPDLMRRSPALVRLVRDAFQLGRLVVSVGHGAWVLITAGVLAGRTVTCHRAIRDDVANAGALYVDREAVRDGNLLTARSADDLPVLMRDVAGALERRAARLAVPS
jgi:protease I